MTQLKPFLYRPALLADETLASYLFRLAFANGHREDIFQKLTSEYLIERDNPIRPKRSGMFEAIATLTGLEPYKAYWASVHGHTELIVPRHVETENITFPNGFVFPQSPDNYLRRHVRSINNSQYCPSCLANGGYQRRSWQLNAVAACCRHKCLLVDKCAQCREYIKVSDLILGQCGKCRFNFVEAPTVSLAEDELGLCTQAVLYYWAKAGPHIWLSLPNQPVRELYSIYATFRQLIFYVEQELSCLHPFPKLSKPFDWQFPRVNNTAKHYVASTTAIKALMNWPNGLFQFLQQYSIRDGQSYTTNLQAHFGTLLTLERLELWQNDGYEFVYSALADYLAANWPASRIKKHPHFKEHPILSFKCAWMAINEASLELKVTDRTVKRLISIGLIRLKKETEFLKIKFLSREDIMTLKARWAQAIPLSDASAWLGLSENVILDLVEINLLTAVRGPKVDGSSIWQIRQADVEDLLEAVHSLGLRHYPNKTDLLDLVTTTQTLSVYGFNAAKVIQLAIQRQILGRCRVEQGLDQLVFSKRSVLTLLEQLRKEQEVVSTLKAAEEIGVKPEVIAIWIKSGLLKPLHKKGQVVYLKFEDVKSFRSEYVRTAEAKRILGVLDVTIQKWTRAGRLKPVSGPGVDSRGVYLYRRRDLLRLAPVSRLTLPQVAKRLNVTPSRVRSWVKAGRIQPVSGPGIDECRHYLFLKDEVNEFALSIGMNVDTA